MDSFPSGLAPLAYQEHLVAVAVVADVSMAMVAVAADVAVPFCAGFPYLGSFAIGHPYLDASAVSPFLDYRHGYSIPYLLGCSRLGASVLDLCYAGIFLLIVCSYHLGIVG